MVALNYQPVQLESIILSDLKNILNIERITSLPQTEQSEKTLENWEKRAIELQSYE